MLKALKANLMASLCSSHLSYGFLHITQGIKFWCQRVNAAFQSFCYLSWCRFNFIIICEMLWIVWIVVVVEGILYGHTVQYLLLAKFVPGCIGRLCWDWWNKEMSRYVANGRVMLFNDVIAAKIWWTRMELNTLQFLVDGSANSSTTWNWEG